MPEVTTTPEINDQYLNVDIILPHGGEEARGCMTKWEHKNYANSTGRANANPILDSCQYVVKFEDSTEAELAANTITQNIVCPV